MSKEVLGSGREDRGDEEVWGDWGWSNKELLKDGTVLYFWIWVVLTRVLQFSSLQSLSRVWLWPHGLQHTRAPCPSLAPGVDSNSCPLSPWCHPTISSAIVPFSSCLQSFPASGSFPMSRFFASGGQSIGLSASTSVLPMNIQDWFLLGWTGWIRVLTLL